jgi:DNA primase
MPRLDYRALRALIPIRHVLDLLGWSPRTIRGDQWRSLCPLHDSSADVDPSFSVNVAKNAYQCFRCKARGNQLDLWAAYTHLPLKPASLDLCRRLGLAPPLISAIRNSENASR